MQKLFYYLSAMLCFSSSCYSALFCFSFLQCFVLLAKMLCCSCTCYSALFLQLQQCIVVLLCATVLSSSSLCHYALFYFCLPQCLVLCLLVTVLRSSSCYNAFFLLQCFLLLATMICCCSCFNDFFLLLQCFPFLFPATMLSSCFSDFFLLLQCFSFLLPATMLSSCFSAIFLPQCFVLCAIVLSFSCYSALFFFYNTLFFFCLLQCFVLGMPSLLIYHCESCVMNGGLIKAMGSDQSNYQGESLRLCLFLEWPRVDPLQLLGQ